MLTYVVGQRMQGVDQCQEWQLLVVDLWASGQASCCGEQGKNLWEAGWAEIAMMVRTDHYGGQAPAPSKLHNSVPGSLSHLCPGSVCSTVLVTSCVFLSSR